jgi:hypothetical protein
MVGGKKLQLMGKICAAKNHRPMFNYKFCAEPYLAVICSLFGGRDYTGKQNYFCFLKKVKKQ